MTPPDKLTFESTELNLSYSHHVGLEKEALSLRAPKVKGLTPSMGFIESCAPLRSPMELLEHARRDAPKFREEAAQKAKQNQRLDAIARVSRFLGKPKNMSKGIGR